MKFIYCITFLLLLTFCGLTFAQPVANFSSDKTSGCGNLPVQFSDNSTGSPTSWLWNFGDGTPTSTQQNPLHFYNAPGTYTVTLTATNVGGSDVETKTAYITVFALPTANFTQSDSIGCVPFTVSFTDQSASSSSSIVSWLWNFGDGNNSTQSNPQHTYTSPGTYTVSLFATDGNGCAGNKIKNNLISVTSAPVAAFTLNSNFSCIAPFNLVFNNTSSSGSGTTYLWNFGDGSPTSTAQTPPSHTYSSFGNYTITLVVTNSSGCTDTAFQTLSINSFSSDFSAADSSGCAPLSTTFSATNPSATSFMWTFPGGSPASSTSASPTVAYNTAGTYSVTLIASNSQGCSDTLTMTDFITVFPLPSVSFSADDSNACSVPFTVNFSSVSPGAATWDWTFTGGSPASSTIENPTITYNAEGNYNVSLTVTDTNGCTRTAGVNNFIKVIFPVANFTASPLKGCKPLTVNFTNSSTASPPVDQWLWTFGDPASGASNTSSAQNPSHLYNDTGVYDVQLIISNAEGCSDTIMRNDYVQVGQQPVADFSPKDTSGCHPFSVPFTNLSSSYTDQWIWSFSNGLTAYNSNDYNPTQTFSDTGFFDVLFIALHHGCADTILVNNAIEVKPAKPVFTASPTIICEQSTPYQVSFTDASIGAEQWTWKFGDATPDFTGQNPPPHIYSSAGSYTAWLVVENFTTGCKDSISTSISISQINVDFATDTFAGCRPLAISFSDSSTSLFTIATKKWLFGDGINTPAGNGNNTVTGVSNTSGTFSKPNHTYASSGFFSPTLIIFDQLGCSDTLTLDSLIEVKPLPVANFTADTTNGCAPVIVQFSDNTMSTSPILSWSWNFGNNNSDTLQNPADTFLLPGQYTVQLIVTDTFNCKDTVVKNNYVNVTFPNPGFSMAADTICNGGLAVFTNSSSGAGLSYSWDFGDASAPDNAANPSHNYFSSSDTTVIMNVSLTVVDSNGCDSTVTSSLVVAIPRAGFYTGAQNDSCPPFDALFVDSSSADIVSWTWDFGDGGAPIIKNSPDAAHTYESAGSYDVSVIATNNVGCKDTVRIDSLINISGPSGTFTFIVDSARCFSEAEFIATTSNASSILWDFRDGGTDSSETVTHRYETGGTYIPILILKDSNNCQVFIESSDTIIVSPANISAFIDPDTNNVYPEDRITFTGSSSSSAPIVSWEWNFGDGKTAVSSFANIQNHKYATSGSYNVILKIRDEEGCISGYDTLITIIEGVIISNIMTPNGDGLNDIFIVRRNGMKEHYLVVFNRWGEKIYEYTAPEVQWSGKNFSGEDVPEGTYYYLLKSTRENGELIENKSYITVVR